MIYDFGLPNADFQIENRKSPIVDAWCLSGLVARIALRALLSQYLRQGIDAGLGDHAVLLGGGAADADGADDLIFEIARAPEDRGNHALSGLTENLD